MSTTRSPLNPTLTEILDRLQTGGALLPESKENLMEVVGILKSYGHVLDAYWRNLTYISESQFLVLFPFFKYFNGDVSAKKLLQHLWHDRINLEFSEYCMRAMLWHGGGGLDKYLDSEDFSQKVEVAIAAKLKGNFLMQGLHRLFPNFLPEQMRQMAYYHALGFFWSFMSPMFLDLSDRYDRGEIQTIADVVNHVIAGLVGAAAKPFTYTVKIKGQDYEIVPASAGLNFLNDTAIPYVEAVFFRSFPFRGTISYNAQDNFRDNALVQKIPYEISQFNYGVLYADPLPVGGAGIPPTLLMQDMRHFLPQYLHDFYKLGVRGEVDLRVKICVSFQKSMFCVTTAAIKALAPFPIDTQEPEQQAANRKYLQGWLKRLAASRILTVQDISVLNV
ncbi:CO2 hydration protein [Tumidithrix elongata RA019]|uniref:CO2 hydration protein n=1 Tax=Tumidithrix elongata BACA0141 TaxID=2716417 RepID=A0AAW9PWV2_9CYAN|nr:CO2 hydration protein [Tumidithrix elongata RA019]